MIKKSNFLIRIWILMLLINQLYISKVLACGAFNGNDNRILTNPTFTWSMNPPVAWTYPDATAISDQSFFPGQSLTQTDAQHQADGDITSAVLEGLNSIGIPGAGIRVIPNYQPPLISDCVKSTGRNPTAIGQTFGIVELGTVVYTAISTVAIAITDCQARNFFSTSTTTPITLTPYIQRSSVSIEGVILNGLQAEQLANAMMVSLNFNKHVRFVTPIVGR